MPRGKPELFDAKRYPRLLKHSTGSRGRATILEVSETSDGFLMAWVQFSDHQHSVLLGRTSDFK